MEEAGDSFSRWSYSEEPLESIYSTLQQRNLTCSSHMKYDNDNGLINGKMASTKHGVSAGNKGTTQSNNSNGMHDSTTSNDALNGSDIRQQLELVLKTELEKRDSASRMISQSQELQREGSEHYEDSAGEYVDMTSQLPFGDENIRLSI